MTEICPIHNCEYQQRRGMANGAVGLHCSWDGSLHPDLFMEMVEKGARLTPTDKSYKVYIEWEDDTHAKEPRVVSRSNSKPKGMGGYVRASDVDLSAVDTSGWSEIKGDEWIRVVERGSTIHDKFYFEHLSAEQRTRFIEILNAGAVGLEYPGYFYRTPFFIGGAS